MATTPHVEPPKQPPPPPKAPEAKAAAAPPAPAQHHAVLDPATALTLFRNGHRIAKDGDPQDVWISMGRGLDGTELYQQPLTQVLIDQISGGSYYLVDDQAYLTQGT